jgi:CRP-like cAMP-binding protein
MTILTLFAVGAGARAAAALPIGAAVGLVSRPGPKVTSALLAFGAGALLFALSVEIVAESFHEFGFWPLAVGSVLGGVVFEAFNQILNQKGAFLRKFAVAVRQLSTEKRKQQQMLLEQLSKVHLLQALPPEEITPLVQAAQPVLLAQGEELFREGDAGSSLYLVVSGALGVTRGGVNVATIGAGDTVGEMAVVTGAPRSASIRALEPTKLFRIPKHAFDDLVRSAARVRDTVSELITLRTEQLKERLLVPQAEAEDWKARAAAQLSDERHDRPSDREIEEAAHAQKHPVMGIWLGNLLDAIPESLVLGTTVVGAGALSWPLMAGIFLANFPEAMSSSGIMRSAGLKVRTILIMWGSIVLVGGVCAGAGNLFLVGVSGTTYGIIEGTAVGAMLTMIAETMLPEAFERGGAVVGLSTLLGFLAALSVKTLG